VFNLRNYKRDANEIMGWNSIPEALKRIAFSLTLLNELLLHNSSLYSDDRLYS
jgi:hypothetical protein